MIGQDHSGRPRIFLVHALSNSVGPAGKAAETVWPEAECFDLLDTALSADLATGVAGQREIDERIMGLARYAARAGKDGRPTEGILFTCSAFGPSITRVKQSLAIPVLDPTEAAIAEALSTGRRLGLVVTFEPSLRMLTDELCAAADRLGVPVKLQTRCVDQALVQLNRGRGDLHDDIVAEAVAAFDEVDAVILGQFSMARAVGKARLATTVPVISTPESAVRALRHRCTLHKGDAGQDSGVQDRAEALSDT